MKSSHGEIGYGAAECVSAMFRDWYVLKELELEPWKWQCGAESARECMNNRKS